MDAITLLRNDHKTVEKLFKRLKRRGDGALVEKRQIVDRIVEELSIHATIEEQLFYPVGRATVPGTEDIALESLEEHQPSSSGCFQSSTAWIRPPGNSMPR